MLYLVLLALAVSPDALAAKAEQAREAMAARDFGRAIALYRELNQSDPGNEALQQNLGLALYSAGRYAESIKVLSEVLRVDPKNQPALLFSGIDWNRLDEPRRAVPLLQRSLSGTGETAAARAELGHAQFALRNLRAAVDDFAKACASEPSNPAYWKDLGVAYWALAKENFEWIESHAPFSPEWFALMARFELEKEHYNRAFQFYREAVAGSPGLSGVHSGLAEVYRRTGHAEWALIEESRERSAVVKPGTEVRGYYLEAIEDQRRAAEALDRLERLPPGPEVHELLGFAYRAQHRDTESAAEFHEALSLEPENSGLQREWATSLWLSGECSQAEPILEQLLRTNPRSAQVNHILGDCLVQEKRPRQALPYLKIALKLDPSFLPAQASLGRACMHLGLYSDAIPPLREALALNDKSLLFQLAEAYRKTGDDADANRYLQDYRRYESDREKLSRVADEAEITSP